MVSIVLVTYNRAHRLEKSIKDILEQSFRQFELIICDDCSPDNTEAICKAFVAKDDRIRYYRHSTNIRMPANLNFGIQKAKHDLIAILHDGDSFRHDLIGQWYNALSSNSSAGFAFCSIGTTDDNNILVQEFVNFEEGLIQKDRLLYEFFRRPHFDSPVYGEAMVRRSLLEKNGYFSEKFGFYADVDLWMEILHNHDAYYCAEVMITGPLKSLEPNQFNNNLIKVFLYLYQMHSSHRKKTFANNLFVLSAEMMRLQFYAVFHLIYCLLLIIKNSSFSTIVDAQRRLTAHPQFLPISIVTLMLYPILKPLLVIFEYVKTFRNSNSRSAPSTSG